MPLLTCRYFRGTQKEPWSRERFLSGRRLAGDERLSEYPSSLLLCAVKVFASLFYGFLAKCRCELRLEKSALKVQRICICATDSLTKSGKSTDSLMYLGKIYRFFEEIRRTSGSRRPPGEKPVHFQHMRTRKPGTHTKWIPGGRRVCAASAVVTRVARESQLARNPSHVVQRHPRKNPPTQRAQEGLQVGLSRMLRA